MPVFGDFRGPTGFGNYGFRNGLATLTTTRGLAAVAELGDQGCLLKLAHGPEALAFAAHGYDVPALSSLNGTSRLPALHYHRHCPKDKTAASFRMADKTHSRAPGQMSEVCPLESLARLRSALRRVSVADLAMCI
jgi:hypothetical protein